MRSTSIWSVVVAAIISATSAQALESSITARSSLPAGELWSAWDPLIERCDLSADGKQRTNLIFGGVGKVVAELEDRDDASRSYSWKTVSGPSLVANYRGTIRVIADGQGSALRWTASYEAKGVSDAEAQKFVNGVIHRTLCVNSPLSCGDDQRSLTPAEVVEFGGSSFEPLTLRGYLRRPDGAGPFPAVVLLHGCSGSFEPLDQLWGVRIAAWGYVTLTIDRFGPRGLKNTCRRGSVPADTSFDGYRALDFLVQQRFVDPKRVIAVGFSQGGWLGLSSVERGTTEQEAKNKFRAAAAFYPPCLAIKGAMTVPTLILIGESDDWVSADACRKLAAGQDDWGVSRQKGDGPPIQLIVYPNAYHGFDLPGFRIPLTYFGHHIEFNKTASEQSSDALHAFLKSVQEPR